MPFLIAAVVAVLASPLLAIVGRRFRLIDRPGALKIHGTPVPVTGGAAVVLAVVTALALTGGSDPWIAAAACLALGGGMVDDARPLPPWVRVVLQASAGLLLVGGGYRLEPLGVLGAPGLVVATVACCNAVNMVDGQDGLAAGLGAIAALGLAAILSLGSFETALALALAGALVGFVVWNRTPARIFLGDGGAYAVGVFLVASASQATAAGWRGLLAAGACLGVFAYELVATVIRRLASSAPTARGDRDHSYDRIGARLGSRSSATFVLWGLGIFAALVGLAIWEMSVVPALLVIVAALVLTVVLEIRLLPVSAMKEEP